MRTLIKNIISFINNSNPDILYNRNIKLLRKPTEGLGKNKDYFGIELIVMKSLLISEFIRITPFIEWLFKKAPPKTRNCMIELYVVLRFLLLACGLVLGFSNHRLFVIFTCFFIWEIIITNSGIIFLLGIRQQPKSFGRSTLLIMFNFLELILSFAIIYLYTDSIGGDSGLIAGWGEAIYFSLVTAATVGYGDMGPIGKIGQLLVVIQILISIFFITVILVFFINNLISSHKNNKKD